MMPDTLAQALVRLNHAMARCRIAETLAPFRAGSPLPRPGIEGVLATFATLSVEQAQFSPADRSVLVATGLAPLLDAAWWADLVTALSRCAMSEDLSFRLDEIGTRLQLVASVFPALALLAAAPDETAKPDAGGLTLFVVGKDRAPPSLVQIAGVLEAMNQLWWVAEELTGQRGLLHLLAMRPGPTTTLLFHGPDEPMDELRVLLASVWEQALRLPNIAPDQYASMVPGTLPVLDRIGRSGRSDAMRVRAAVESGVKRLLEAGCSLREEPAAVTAGPFPASPMPARPPPASPTFANPAPANPMPSGATRPAAGQVEPPRAPTGHDDDVSHLAAVIAEERRQLQQADPPRRLWQGAGSTATR